jgi:hypothetical protein
MKLSKPVNHILLSLLMGALLFAGRPAFVLVTLAASDTPPGDRPALTTPATAAGCQLNSAKGAIKHVTRQL